MLGNDQAGDCVAVTWANVRRLVTAILTAAPVYPSQAQVRRSTRPRTRSTVPRPRLKRHGHPDAPRVPGRPPAVRTASRRSRSRRSTSPTRTRSRPRSRCSAAVWIGINVQDHNENEFGLGDAVELGRRSRSTAATRSSPAGTARPGPVRSAGTSGSSPGRQRPASPTGSGPTGSKRLGRHLARASRQRGVPRGRQPGRSSRPTTRRSPGGPFPAPVPAPAPPPAPSPAPAPPPAPSAVSDASRAASSYPGP